MCCCWGACSPFLLLFSVPVLSGFCFSFFLWFFVPFLPSGRGVLLFFFLPLLLGLVFVCFSLIFGVFFVVFSSLRGVFLLWVPFWACFGVPGGCKKGFLLFFFGAFFVLLLGCMFLVFASLFCPRSFWVFVFLLFVFFCSFFALGAGRLAVLFSPSSFGACFCLFFFYFWWFFRRFFFSKGLVLFVGPFLGLFWGPGRALRKDFFCFFWAFFVLLLGCMFLVFASLFCPRSFWVLFFFFFLVFCSFFTLGAGRLAVLFSPSSFGACFCLFFFYF